MKATRPTVESRLEVVVEVGDVPMSLSPVKKSTIYAKEDSGVLVIQWGVPLLQPVGHDITVKL